MRFQTLYEGRYFLVPSFLGGAFFWWLAGDWWAWTIPAVLGTLVFMFCANFFRDPERRIAPGDGRIRESVSTRCVLDDFSLTTSP